MTPAEAGTFEEDTSLVAELANLAKDADFSYKTESIDKMTMDGTAALCPNTDYSSIFFGVSASLFSS